MAFLETSHINHDAATTYLIIALGYPAPTSDSGPSGPSGIMTTLFPTLSAAQQQRVQGLMQIADDADMKSVASTGQDESFLASFLPIASSVKSLFTAASSVTKAIEAKNNVSALLAQSNVDPAVIAAIQADFDKYNPAPAAAPQTGAAAPKSVITDSTMSIVLWTGAGLALIFLTFELIRR